jgi:putative nucleotidyltransferase with HDIG domain
MVAPYDLPGINRGKISGHLQVGVARADNHPRNSSLSSSYNVICGTRPVEVKRNMKPHQLQGNGLFTNRIPAWIASLREPSCPLWLAIWVECYDVGIMSARTADWALLTEFTQSESLRKHALAVDACMRAYARKFGADEELWGTVGLLHDFDYEKYPTPQEHPYKGNEILKQRGYSDEIRRAIMSHAEYSGVSRDSPMEKALFACDELAGFITAVALVKPSKSLAEVEVKSVRKKMKDKAFARSVNRDDIVNGARDLAVDLDEHIAFCIEALKGIASEIGLAGQI